MASKQSSAAKPRLFTPTFLVAWLINFSMFLVFYLLVTIMALYAVKEFSASNAAAGFASSSFVVGATFARMFSGWLVDSMGGRKILFTTLAVIAVTCAGYLVAGTLVAVIIVRALHGIAYALASTAVMAIAQGAIPSSRRAEGTGYFTMGNTLATAIGPALGLAMSSSLGYTSLFVFSLALAVVSLGLAFTLPKPDTNPASNASKKFQLSDIVHPTVLPIGSFMLLIGLAYAGVITFLNQYSVQENLTTGAGFFFLASAFSMISARTFLGRLQDHRGDNPVIAIGVVCYVICLALLGIATSDWMVVVAGIFSGLGYGTIAPACQAIAVRCVPAHKMGTGISTLFLLSDVGLGLGPILLGYIASNSGFAMMYLGLSALTLIAGIYYIFIHGRKPQSKPHHVQIATVEKID
ncbi:MFS transporter [Corynebacterium lactis]|uniref:MFS transporter permease n=1 Tax=Corynebacterium lactis RW2-5 TaxID=1408189 RepID=A0A0K2H1V4_9CORY|nr:MFS transporter [Corynebacterium lactis]ALA68022.1 MFS transporter permease [Corynebacterium lactis RW2-5]